MPVRQIVYGIAAHHTDGYTYGCNEVEHIFADKDIAQYIVDRANEHINTKYESATTYSVYEFEISNITSTDAGDKIARALLKEYNNIKLKG